MPPELAEPGSRSAPGQSLTVPARRRRAPLLLDLRARGPAAADRGPRGARRRRVPVAGPRAPAGRRASRCSRRPARSRRTWPRRAQHVLIAAGSRDHAGAVDRRLGARRTPRVRGDPAVRQPAHRHGDVRRRARRPEGRLPGPAAAWSTCCPASRRRSSCSAAGWTRASCAPCCRLTGRRAGVDHWWLCGPFGMVTDAIAVLAELGVPRRADAPRAVLRRGRAAAAGRSHPEPRRPVPAREVTVVLDGRTTTVTVPAGVAGPRRRPAGPPRPAVRLQGRGLRHLPGPAGHEGEVTMRRNFALEAAEVAAGFVLTCQSLAGPARSRSTTTVSGSSVTAKGGPVPQPDRLRESFEPIERASVDELRALQLDRLRWSLRHAYVNVPHYRRRSTPPGCTRTTARTWPTWPASRSPARPTCGRTTRSGCSRCPGSRSPGCTRRPALPAGPPWSGIRPGISTCGRR